MEKDFVLSDYVQLMSDLKAKLAQKEKCGNKNSVVKTGLVLHKYYGVFWGIQAAGERGHKNQRKE